MDKNDIETMFGDWVAASNRGGEDGATGYASFVTENAVMLPPNELRVDGRESVRELIKEFTQADGFSVSFSPTDIDILADGVTAHTFGVYEFSMRDEAGKTISDRGKFFDVLQKQTDGTWKCSVGMWNSDISAEI